MHPLTPDQCSSDSAGRSRAIARAVRTLFPGAVPRLVMLAAAVLSLCLIART